MRHTPDVSLLVYVPRALRTQVRVAAALEEVTMRWYIIRALESAVGVHPVKGPE